MSRDPPSSPSSITDAEDDSSFQSTSSLNTLRNDSLSVTEPHISGQSNSVVMTSPQLETSYGTALQLFSKDMINSMSKYKVLDDLTDSNYPTWSQSIKEVFMSMRLIKFLKVENYKDPSLSEETNEVTSFNITTYILNRLDAHNNTQTRNHLTDPADPSEILYDPFKCCSYLQKRHNEITEDKLTAVTRALHKCKILKSDSLSMYLDKFKNLVREYYYYCGQMPDTQTARMLIMSITSLSETTVESIYATVTPLTRKGVSDYLRLYEQRHEWSSTAIREANGVGSVNSVKKISGSRCSETVCVGPHPEKECWSKPENREKKESFLARRKSPNSTSSSSNKHTVRGVKKVN